ncbi:hypothetical protein BIW11_07185, partial [Tropilaelaps mercedesae]
CTVVPLFSISFAFTRCVYRYIGQLPTACSITLLLPLGASDGQLSATGAMGGLWPPAPSASPNGAIGCLPLVPPVPVSSPLSLLQVVPGTPAPRDNEMARYEDLRSRFDGSSMTPKGDCVISGSLQKPHQNQRLHRLSSADYNNYGEINLNIKRERSCSEQSRSGSRSTSVRPFRWSPRSRSPVKSSVKRERSRSPSRADSHRGLGHRRNNRSPLRNFRDSRPRAAPSRSSSHREGHCRETNGAVSSGRNGGYQHQPSSSSGTSRHRDHRG